MIPQDYVILFLCGVIAALVWSERQQSRQFRELCDMMDSAMATLAKYKDALAQADRTIEFWKTKADQ